VTADLKAQINPEEWEQLAILVRQAFVARDRDDDRLVVRLIAAFSGWLERGAYQDDLKEAVGWYVFANDAGKSNALTTFAEVLHKASLRAPGPRLQTAALVVAFQFFIEFGKAVGADVERPS
jgi:hypothetical protein